ncbi:MAG: LTA synthase family protein [Ruminococcaceae bacterium]|nr:LTA synthase family protein [Oscillospiraceae bacterium]
MNLKNKRNYCLIPIIIFLAAYYGYAFYMRWIPFPQMIAIANMFCMPKEAILMIGSLILPILSLYFMYTGLCKILEILSEIRQQSYLAQNLLSCLIASVTTVVSTQIMSGVEISSMGYFKLFICALFVASVIIFIYCISKNLLPSILLGSSIFMIISTINAYVYSFRNRLFEPVDIFSAETAINVIKNYNLLPIPVNILIGWSVFIIVLIALSFFQHKKRPTISNRRRLLLSTTCLVSFISILLYANSLKTYHWDVEGARYNGYILDFSSKFKEIAVQKPDNYDLELINSLADQYISDTNDTDSDPSKKPHIIVIMDEAFSDLGIIGDFSTNIDVMPFISTLKENTVCGYALTSVYGGNTANSEYEFLTGNSMAWISPNAVPYYQYIRSSTYSIASYLKSSYGYQCIAMHPFESNGWNRPAAYKHLGFDKCYFIEDFPQSHIIRNYVSDQEMFEFLIQTYETQKSNPLFIFGVTMQNHGNYSYTGENYTKHISLTDHINTFPKIEQYLSLIHETDKAVEKLITYFQNVSEDVVIVFFGDHQPSISEEFFESINEASENSLDKQQLLYKVPFFIWANYDIEEDNIECTSLNYLSTHVYDVAKIALPPYNKFLCKLEEEIPSINANGFYSSSNNCYLPFSKASSEELVWLELYEALQYNSIFDKKNKNEILFPSS